MRRAALAVLVGLLLAGCAKKEPHAEAGFGPVYARRSLTSRLFGAQFDRALMKDGFRAVALPLDRSQLANVRAGDRVDVLSVFDSARPRGGVEKVSATILQNEEVLGVRRGWFGSKGVLTLRLNPNEAQYAALAVQQSELFVIVRHEGDLEIHPMQMATFRKLFQ